LNVIEMAAIRSDCRHFKLCIGAPIDYPDNQPTWVKAPLFTDFNIGQNTVISLFKMRLSCLD